MYGVGVREELFKTAPEREERAAFWLVFLSLASSVFEYLLAHLGCTFVVVFAKWTHVRARVYLPCHFPPGGFNLILFDVASLKTTINDSSACTTTND